MSGVVEDKIKSFIDFHAATDVPIVLVTSGGTIVPLEKNMVRFIDNFSQGNRGSASVESFLSEGYAVVFLFRKGSKMPFTRVCSTIADDKCAFLSRVRFEGIVLYLFNQIWVCADCGLLLFKNMYAGSRVVLNTSEKEAQMLQYEANASTTSVNLGFYLPIQFETLQQYLQVLELSALLLGTLGPRVCFYLAAAVSDFFVPEEKVRYFSNSFCARFL
jgi:phosphopantothenate---cysteine ligase (ATP)